MPTYVDNQNVRSQIEAQILTELEVKGIKPYEFDYSDSKDSALQKLQIQKLPDIKDVVSNEKPALI